MYRCDSGFKMFNAYFNVTSLVVWDIFAVLYSCPFIVCVVQVFEIMANYGCGIDHSF
jgi:hypothetical protein